MKELISSLLEAIRPGAGQRGASDFIRPPKEPSGLLTYLVILCNSTMLEMWMGKFGTQLSHSCRAQGRVYDSKKTR